MVLCETSREEEEARAKSIGEPNLEQRVADDRERERERQRESERNNWNGE